MADSTIQLPYTATTSGDLLDASLLGSVKRERMVIANDASTAVAVVTSSGDLKVAAVIVGQPVIITGSVTANLSSNPALTSGIVTLSSPMAISSGLITLSSAIGISSGLVTLTGTNTVTLSSNPVTAQVISLSSGTVTLSSAIGISSGIITLSSNPVTGQIVSLSSGTVSLSSVIGISSGLVTLSSNPVAGQIVSLSSGTVTISNPSTAINLVGTSGALIPGTSSGGLFVHLTNGSAGGGSTEVSIFGSSGAFAQVTSSGGMWVQLTNGSAGGGSTAVNILGSTGAFWTITSAGAGDVHIVSVTGAHAPVTTSGGLLVQFPVHLIGRIDSTIGAPVAPTQITTAAGRLFSVTISATGAAAHAIKLFNDTGSGSSSTGYTYFFATPGSAGLTQVQFSAGSGIAFADGGLRGAFVVGTTSTGATTAAFVGYVEYLV